MKPCVGAHASAQAGSVTPRARSYTSSVNFNSLFENVANIYIQTKTHFKISNISYLPSWSNQMQYRRARVRDFIFCATRCSGRSTVELLPCVDRARLPLVGLAAAVLLAHRGDGGDKTENHLRPGCVIASFPVFMILTVYAGRDAGLESVLTCLASRTRCVQVAP